VLGEVTKIFTHMSPSFS